MLNEKDFEILKECFLEQERLFKKLLQVCNLLEDLEYDGVGHYIEEEQRLLKNKQTLERKIIKAIQEKFPDKQVEVIANDILHLKELSLKITDENKRSILVVNFAIEGSLSLSNG